MPDGESISVVSSGAGSAPPSAGAANRPTESGDAVPAVRSRPSRDGWKLLALLALVLATMFVASLRPFTPGSTAGYWVGVAGGVAMLLLFLYPLRKHARFARTWGRTRVWFALHMVLGILGPLLIVLHSMLRLGSLNATVAFASMILVASSGVVGRYLYARIHHGLYGRHASLAELRREAGFGSDRLRSRLAFAPAVEQRLQAFALRAEVVGREGMRRPWRFFLLGTRAWMEELRCRAELHRALAVRGAARGWSADKLRRRMRDSRRLVASYLQAVQRVAQFTVFERLFSWWHVLHVPLVYMMVITAIVHVVAVHMY
jgi:hypothetical protein